MSASMAEQIQTAARELFGFTQLRAGQEDAVTAILEGHDTLAVMSTGSGKSAIYQLAGQFLEGSTVVVSPLISLQRDQIDAVQETGAARGAALDSSLTDRQRSTQIAAFCAQEIDVLFLAPEQLGRSDTLEALTQAPVSLMVIDEAHCISEWGHDFRPDYLRLGALIEEIGHPSVLALTATASPPVREEIVSRLGMRDPTIVIRGFDRPNLRLEVVAHEHEATQRKALLDRVSTAETPAIVYVATRREAEELADELTQAGLSAAAYHAGLGKAARDDVQDRFMADDIDVIAATTAFGMGVDKPNVRLVAHLEPSDSVDSYYQEIGRAGRDGEPALAVLFYRPADIGKRRFYAAGGADLETIAEVAEALSGPSPTTDPEELAESLELSKSKVLTTLSRLEDVGAIAFSATGDISTEALDASSVTDLSAQAAELEQARQSFDQSRLDMMRSYAEDTGCRRRFILSYFGEPAAPECGNCDNCATGQGSADDHVTEEPFAVGSRISHAQWGAGTVQRYDSDRIIVLFDSEGYRTLDLTAVLDRGLLEPG